MSKLVNHRRSTAMRHLLAGLVMGVSLVGCSKIEDSWPTTGPAATTASPAGGTAAPVEIDPRYLQPFTTATLDSPPDDDQWLPDLTLTGKSVGKLYTEVVAAWDTIPLVAPNGKWIAYEATLETQLGPIVIAFRPDLAPNHVRNFVSLAKAGYYEGLVFERTLRAESKENPGNRLELIEAGCPKGTGESGYGSIGYWLKPEFNADVIHEEGTVGACHGEADATAGCKFYITLSKAPFMDGSYTVFGKVTAGLDVARRVFSQPVRNDPEFPEGDRPEKPIVIQKVTIRSTEVDKLPGM